MTEKESFWSTLPGILTAIGGIILAIAALVTALHPIGPIPNPTPAPTTIQPTFPTITTPPTTIQPTFPTITTPPTTIQPTFPTITTPPIPAPAPFMGYNVTIWSWDSVNGWVPVEPIIMDGNSMGFSTPHTFTGLSGTHTFTVPNTNVDGNQFTEWDTGETSTTLSVSSAGTHTARYYPTTPPITTYNVTIWSWDSVNGWVSVGPIFMDGNSTGFSTGHTFPYLTGTHTFTVPNTDPYGNPFTRWNTGETSTTLSVSSEGTYTAQYYPYNVYPITMVHP
jgi:hypothetical protein